MVRLPPRTIGLVLVAVFWPATASAYRPFDATDAAVAETGRAELEIGPVEFVSEASDRSLVAPSLIANFGVVRDWELVAQGRNFVLLSGDAASGRVRLLETGLFMKGVLRDGALQGGSGPSVATEIGPLLPEANGESGMGFSAAVIASHRWPWATVHINAQPALSRAHHFDFFGAVIVEGPFPWAVRPVSEFVVDREIDGARLVSGLAGAIWRAGEAVSFDAAIRAGRVNDTNLFEARAGLTWALALGSSR